MSDAAGLLYRSTPAATVGLVVEDGIVVDSPPYARKWALGRGARELWREQAARGVRLDWLPRRVRVLVTGSRMWTSVEVITDAIDAVNREHSGQPVVLVHGDNPGTEETPGADRTAAAVAAGIGWEVEPHPVSRDQWRRVGRKAGPLRNRRMLARGADVCLAFYQAGAANVGTSDCAGLAEAAGIETRRYWSSA